MNPKDRNRVSKLPWRYGLFLAILMIAVPLMLLLPWYQAVLVAFDLAALGYFMTMPSLFRLDDQGMRVQASRNDPEARILLLFTGIVMIVILIAIGTELTQRSERNFFIFGLCLATLGIAWCFSNLVYALHYAHLYYSVGQRQDRKRITFPGDERPDYWDFVYFSFTLGMTFQTSDVVICDSRIRRIVTFHALAAFVFNLGILAFSINMLAGLRQ